MNPSLALLAWPVMALWVFSAFPLRQAIVWNVLLATLFLPSAHKIDLPGLPDLDKQSLPNLVLLMLVVAREPLRLSSLPGFALVCLGVMVAGDFGTVLTNADALVVGGDYLRGLEPYDAISSAAFTLLRLIPFLIGWRFLGGEAGHRACIRILFLCGLIYAPLMLLEVRFSPQLHNWIYGYFPHVFGQTMRAGGFRPVVFLENGLWCAFFAMTATVACAT